MGLHFRKSHRLLGGVLTVNATEKGVSSFTVKPLPRVSWNSRTRKWTVDLPGPWKWKS